MNNWKISRCIQILKNVKNAKYAERYMKKHNITREQVDAEILRRKIQSERMTDEQRKISRISSYRLA